MNAGSSSVAPTALPITVRLSLVGLAALLGAAGTLIGGRSSRSATIDLGPTDAAYVVGFRDIETDPPIFFRWSSDPSSELVLPLGPCGGGSVRLRVRRHFEDSAFLTVSLDGLILGQREVKARVDAPYDVIEFPFTKSTCARQSHVLLESVVKNGRPLGVAVDWVEIRSESGFAPSRNALARAAGLGALMMSLLLTVAAAPLLPAIGLAAIASAGLAFGFACHPIGADRMLVGVFSACVLAAAVGFPLWRLGGLSAFPQSSRRVILGSMCLALVSRAAFLHPAAFYPDYRVHGLVQQTLKSQGIASFLDRLFETQYARSLGLQEIGGRWYPFPYPPGAYLAAEATGRAFGLTPLMAIQTTALTAATLLPIMVGLAGQGLGLPPPVGALGALCLALHPLLIRRTALGYFPGVIGQFVDACVIVLALRLYRHPQSPSLPRAAAVGIGAAFAFLVYAQSIANFGLLFVSVLLILALARSRQAGRLGLALGAALAFSLALSIMLFYAGYLPVFSNVVAGQPQPEARVLDRLDDLRRAAGANSPGDRDEGNDPYSGASVNPLRGLARLAARIWRFNGPFGLLAMVGAVALVLRTDRPLRDLAAAWLLVPVWISVLAAGLPGPNAFQHLKDLEFATPLLCLGLADVVQALWSRSRLAGGFLAGAWLVFGLSQLASEVLARLVPLVGR